MLSLRGAAFLFCVFLAVFFSIFLHLPPFRHPSTHVEFHLTSCVLHIVIIHAYIYISSLNLVAYLIPTLRELSFLDWILDLGFILRYIFSSRAFLAIPPLCISALLDYICPCRLDVLRNLISLVGSLPVNIERPRARTTKRFPRTREMEHPRLRCLRHRNSSTHSFVLKFSVRLDIHYIHSWQQNNERKAHNMALPLPVHVLM